MKPKSFMNHLITIIFTPLSLILSPSFCNLKRQRPSCVPIHLSLSSSLFLSLSHSHSRYLSLPLSFSPSLFFMHGSHCEPLQAIDPSSTRRPAEESYHRVAPPPSLRHQRLAMRENDDAQDWKSKVHSWISPNSYIQSCRSTHHLAQLLEKNKTVPTFSHDLSDFLSMLLFTLVLSLIF